MRTVLPLPGIELPDRDEQAANNIDTSPNKSIDLDMFFNN
jgi:hypothetical protein